MKNESPLSFAIESLDSLGDELQKEYPPKKETVPEEPPLAQFFSALIEEQKNQWPITIKKITLEIEGLEKKYDLLNEKEKENLIQKKMELHKKQFFPPKNNFLSTFQQLLTFGLSSEQESKIISNIESESLELAKDIKKDELPEIIKNQLEGIKKLFSLEENEKKFEEERNIFLSKIDTLFFKDGSLPHCLLILFTESAIENLYCNHSKKTANQFIKDTFINFLIDLHYSIESSKENIIKLSANRIKKERENRTEKILQELQGKEKRPILEKKRLELLDEAKKTADSQVWKEKLDQITMTIYWELKKGFTSSSFAQDEKLLAEAAKKSEAEFKARIREEEQNIMLERHSSLKNKLKRSYFLKKLHLSIKNQLLSEKNNEKIVLLKSLQEKTTEELTKLKNVMYFIPESSEQNIRTIFENLDKEILRQNCIKFFASLIEKQKKSNFTNSLKNLAASIKDKKDIENAAFLFEKSILNLLNDIKTTSLKNKIPETGETKLFFEKNEILNKNLQQDGNGTPYQQDERINEIAKLNDEIHQMFFESDGNIPDFLLNILSLKIFPDPIEIKAIKKIIQQYIFHFFCEKHYLEKGKSKEKFFLSVTRTHLLSEEIKELDNLLEIILQQTQTTTSENLISEIKDSKRKYLSSGINIIIPPKFEELKIKSLSFIKIATLTKKIIECSGKIKKLEARVQDSEDRLFLPPPLAIKKDLLEKQILSYEKSLEKHKKNNQDIEIANQALIEALNMESILLRYEAYLENILQKMHAFENLVFEKNTDSIIIDECIKKPFKIAFNASTKNKIDFKYALSESAIILNNFLFEREGSLKKEISLAFGEELIEMAYKKYGQELTHHLIRQNYARLILKKIHKDDPGNSKKPQDELDENLKICLLSIGMLSPEAQALEKWHQNLETLKSIVTDDRCKIKINDFLETSRNLNKKKEKYFSFIEKEDCSKFEMALKSDKFLFSLLKIVPHYSKLKAKVFSAKEKTREANEFNDFSVEEASFIRKLNETSAEKWEKELELKFLEARCEYITLEKIDKNLTSYLSFFEYTFKVELKEIENLKDNLTQAKTSLAKKIFFEGQIQEKKYAENYKKEILECLDKIPKSNSKNIRSKIALYHKPDEVKKIKSTILKVTHFCGDSEIHIIEKSLESLLNARKESSLLNKKISQTLEKISSYWKEGEFEGEIKSEYKKIQSFILIEPIVKNALSELESGGNLASINLEDIQKVAILSRESTLNDPFLNQYYQLIQTAHVIFHELHLIQNQRSILNSRRNSKEPESHQRKIIDLKNLRLEISQLSPDDFFKKHISLEEKLEALSKDLDDDYETPAEEGFFVALKSIIVNLNTAIDTLTKKTKETVDNSFKKEWEEAKSAYDDDYSASGLEKFLFKIQKLFAGIDVFINKNTELLTATFNSQEIEKLLKTIRYIQGSNVNGVLIKCCSKEESEFNGICEKITEIITIISSAEEKPERRKLILCGWHQTHLKHENSWKNNSSLKHFYEDTYKVLNKIKKYLGSKRSLFSYETKIESELGIQISNILELKSKQNNSLEDFREPEKIISQKEFYNLCFRIEECLDAIPENDPDKIKIIEDWNNNYRKHFKSWQSSKTLNKFNLDVDMFLNDVCKHLFSVTSKIAFNLLCIKMSNAIKNDPKCKKEFEETLKKHPDAYKNSQTLKEFYTEVIKKLKPYSDQNQSSQIIDTKSSMFSSAKKLPLLERCLTHISDLKQDLEVFLQKNANKK
jgi:hypothetical protein